MASDEPLKLTEWVGEQPGQVLGNYQLIRVIGEGAMGRVFLAKHVRLGRQVAIKVLRPEHARSKGLIERFFQEARTVNEINHEHIVEIYDFVEDELGRAYCVMELLSGFNLAELMRREPLGVGRMIHIAGQLCGALGAGHRAGVVHRDVKPDNVFITERSGFKDYVKVLDFGVAKLLNRGDDAPGGGGLDAAIVGTPSYMAPEQAAGSGTDHRADIYAVGVVLYEMIAGRPPFDGHSFGQMMVQIATHAPGPLADTLPGGEAVPAPLRELIMRCLEKSPDLRPQSMVELQKALEALRGVGARPAEVVRRRSPWKRAAVGGTVLAAATAGAYAAWVARPPPVTPAPESALAAPPAAPEPLPPVEEAPRVTVTVRSTPPGAWLSRADTGKGLGATPFQGTFERSPAGVAVRFELEGFQPAIRQIPLQQDVDLHVLLEPAPPKAGAESDHGGAR